MCKFRHTLNSWQVLEGLGWVTRGLGTLRWVLGIGWIYYREGLAEAVGGDVSFVPAWSVGKS